VFCACYIRKLTLLYKVFNKGDAVEF